MTDMKMMDHQNSHVLSFSRPAISCRAHWSVNFTSVIFTSSIFSAPSPNSITLTCCGCCTTNPQQIKVMEFELYQLKSHFLVFKLLTEISNQWKTTKKGRLVREVRGRAQETAGRGGDDHRANNALSITCTSTTATPSPFDHTDLKWLQALSSASW